MVEDLDLPLTFLLPTHLSEEQRIKLEAEIPNQTYDITIAKLVLGKVATAKRAEFELRSRGIVCEKVEREDNRVKREKGKGVKTEVKAEDVAMKEESDGGAKVKAEGEDKKTGNLKRERSTASDVNPEAKKRRLGVIGGKKAKQEEPPDVKSKIKQEVKDETMSDVITIDDSTTEGEETEGEHAPKKARKQEPKSSSPMLWREYSPSEKVSQISKVASSMTLGGDETEEENEYHGEDADIEWDDDNIKVVKLAWYEESAKKGYLLPLDDYLVYEGRPIHKAPALPHPHPRRQGPPDDILLRARADPPPKAAYNPIKAGKYGASSPVGSQSQSQYSITRPTHLLHETTSEHDNPNKLPPIPDYLHSTYSCQRPTPLHPPNEEFIKQLKKIRQARVLTLDEIGVRAYSSAIASIAAYPHEITSPLEILRLPVCSEKIASLWQEWQEYHSISAVREIEADADLKIVDLFYNIWGVGAKGARDFYYHKGWRDLDDVVEYGWDTLSRVQQIGVKYYDEFLDPIPRDEVESIAQTILDAANKVAKGSQITIVGGHRRGKEESGDVDVVVSHPEESVTAFMVTRIVQVLEQWGWITHTLTLSTANSERNQTPVSYKGEGGVPGTGFDTLDKALVVWQNPIWPTMEEDLEKNPKAKNPNVHRRVDIILSPWKTVGCAVAGWTSGTTFQRDLRRWAKTKGLKFDSSGVRSREDGRWVDYENRGGKSKDMLEAEKKVFEGLELEWREPTLRCTG